MAQLSRSRVADVRDFILSRDEIDEAPLEDSPDPFWQGLSGVGSMIWFDTGDIDAASSNWSAEMSALTTNNSLLNKEVQKGIYDDLIVRAKEMLGSMEPDDLVMEVAFILNAVHGMRLARRFNADVSVELHTGISYDVEAIAHYGKRFHEINPDRFIVKVPFTSDGILGARVIREAGIRVNLTLGFSARQNVIAAVVSKPNFVNVFLGRLNSFVADNGLGTGNMIGEKTTLASQRSVHSVTQEFVEPVHQIAASIRGAGQLEALAGVDVITMPTDVAEEAKQSLRGAFADHSNDDYPAELKDPAVERAARIDTLWDVHKEVVDFARTLDADPPASGTEVQRIAGEMGCRDVFPRLSREDRDAIAADGKIPSYDRWKKRIESGEVAIETLMNEAGLATFAADQAALDERIRGLVL